MNLIGELTELLNGLKMVDSPLSAPIFMIKEQESRLIGQNRMPLSKKKE
ncbi:hypothetical protein ES703_23239 [subsurface metagenome]